MSLYNMFNGMNPATFFVLPMLDRHPENYGRFRDCFLYDDEHPEYDNHISVYTRMGGGNRDSYEELIEELQSHENYVADYDDSFDSTYATFVFSVPVKYREDYDLIVSGHPGKVSKAYQDQLIRVFPKLEEKLMEVFNANL